MTGRKNKVLGAKVSYEEYGLIYQRAGRANKTVSSYIHDIIMGYDPELKAGKEFEKGGSVDSSQLSVDNASLKNDIQEYLGMLDKAREKRDLAKEEVRELNENLLASETKREEVLIELKEAHNKTTALIKANRDLMKETGNKIMELDTKLKASTIKANSSAHKLANIQYLLNHKQPLSLENNDAFVVLIGKLHDVMS